MNLADKYRTFTSPYAAHLFLRDHNYYFDKKIEAYLHFGRDKPLKIVKYLHYLYKIKPLSNGVLKCPKSMTQTTN
jgi:hypothetical protein